MIDTVVSQQPSRFALAAVGSLAIAFTACAPAATSTDESPTGSALSSSSLTDTVEIVAEPASTATSQTSAVQASSAATTPAQNMAVSSCVTWQEHQTNVLSTPEGPLLPNMPTGFEGGCAFGEGMTMRPTIYILRTGIELDQVFDTSADYVAQAAGQIPWAQGQGINFSALQELRNRGDVITYYEACNTTGTYASYCADYSWYIPYALAEDTACFQGHCLKSSAVAAAELQALWDFWDAPTPDADQNARRSQYNTIPLDTLPTDLRAATLRFQLEDVVRQTFGRTVLEEGESPTVMTREDYPVTTASGGRDVLEVVNVLNEGLADDSIGGFRYRLEFESFDGDRLRLIWAGQQHYCRRTQQWTSQVCP